MGIESQIIELEKSLFQSDIRSSISELRSRLAPEFREIASTGEIVDLQDVLERLPKENGWEAKAQDFEFSRLSEDICMLVYKSFHRASGNCKGKNSLRCSIWKRYGDVWKMVFHQGTSIE
ncbi:nuclear transport factor 2 family protein [Simiduia curdlanivorans]|uniref:Nuclear transport factor 2 family protein n=1 Tax=Simiduia curdlanivorans TaxID=1492769 RepID=A0ABV8V5W3_9GAMM